MGTGSGISPGVLGWTVGSDLLNAGPTGWTPGIRPGVPGWTVECDSLGVAFVFEFPAPKISLYVFSPTLLSMLPDVRPRNLSSRADNDESITRQCMYEYS
jgi:hypothetical protein